MTTLILKLSKEAAEAYQKATKDLNRPLLVSVEVEYDQLIDSNDDTVKELVPHTERVTFTEHGSQKLELDDVQGQLNIMLLKSDGTVASSKLLDAADAVEHEITIAEMEGLAASEPEVINPSSIQVERRAQLIPIGVVKPNFAQSSLAIYVINTEDEFSTNALLSSLGFTKDRSASSELNREMLEKTREVSWITANIGIDGSFLLHFERALKNNKPVSAIGWVWLLTGSHSVAGFIADTLVDPRRQVAISLPVLQPLNNDGQTDPDCNCHNIVPTNVTEVEVANNPEVYSEDPGAFCKPFSNPERVLNEKAFAVIARVQQPDIGPMGSVRVHTQHLLDLEPVVNTIMTATVGNASRRRNVVVAQPLSHDALAAALLGAGRPIRVKTKPADIADQKQMSSGRVLMDAKHPAQWEDDIAQYQAATVALGHILEFRVRTRSNGYSLGNVASTLTLAPRQTKRIQKIEFERFERAKREELTIQADAVSDELNRERDYNDTVSAYLSEWATGSSSSGSKAAAGGIGFAIPPIVGGVGGGASKAWSESTQEGTRNTSASEQQRLRDAIRRHGDSLRKLQSTVVTEISQQETVTGTSEILRNPNYGHSLTVIYYQILRHLKVTTEFAGVRECLFVPFAIKPFTLQRAYRWRESIEKYLRSARYRDSVKHLRDVATGFQYSNILPGSRAQQKLTFLRGSVFLTLAVERPHDTADDKFNPQTWAVMASFLGAPAYGIWARLAERSIAERDQLFQREHAPTIAAKWINKLRIQVGGVDLQADCTMATRYSFNGKVRIDFVVPAQSARLYSRAQLQEISVIAASELPPGSVANIKEMTIRYGTANFERTINGLAGADDLITPGTGTVDASGAIITLPLDAWDNVDEQQLMKQSVNELIEHLNEHVEYYHKAIWWNMDRDRLFMLMDGFYVPGTDKVSIASVVDREPIAIIGNSLVYRVGAGTFLGLGKITKPSQLYEAYAGREPAQDPLLISLPTDGLYAQTIMDECLALEEHQGTVDWVLNDPDPELGVIDPSLLSTRRADVGSTLSPTPMPSTIINLQNAPDAPAPSGLQGAFNAVGNAAAFRDMAGLAGTQANAAAALTTAANLATNFGNQAAALKTAELATKVKATEDANKKLAAVQKAKAQDLISKDEASEHANKILSDMHTTAGSEENSGTLENIAQQLMDNGQEGSVGESLSSGFRVIDIKAPEFQSSASSTTTPIVLNTNNGQATNGRAAIFNFGTFVETNRFKTAAKQSDFVDTDVWFNANPGSLMNSNGVTLIQDSGVDPVFSFYHINNAVWKSRLNLGQKYTDAFDTWLSAALQDDIDCIYLTGHHWTDGNNFYLSSGHSQSQFSLSGKKGTGTLDIGRGSSVVKFPVTALKNQCKLIFGYGCDVATPHASKLYQDIFGRGAGDVPVICGWDATISVPDRDQASISPNNLYFEFLKNFADANSAPASNRLQWIYDNHPMELVNAWGHATKSWHKHSARARGKDGKLFKFTHSGGTVTAVHIP